MSCENNKSMECTCTKSCDRHGKCCECIAHHQPKGQFPGCFFSEKAEKEYDRSYEVLVRDRKRD